MMLPTNESSETPGVSQEKKTEEPEEKAELARGLKLISLKTNYKLLNPSLLFN